MGAPSKRVPLGEGYGEGRAEEGGGRRVGRVWLGPSALPNARTPPSLHYAVVHPSREGFPPGREGGNPRTGRGRGREEGGGRAEPKGEPDVLFFLEVFIYTITIPTPLESPGLSLGATHP